MSSQKKIRMNVCPVTAASFLFTSIVVVFCLSRDRKLVREVPSVPKNKSSLSSKSCNLFSGRWVYDDKNYPLYNGQECSFMVDDYACEKHGRKDLKYQHWKWQPHDCDLPRFNATALLEKLRGKRLVFVGDSLNKNQFISLLCLLEPAFPLSTKSSTLYTGSLITYTSIEYNATISFYWEPLLVESNCDDPVHHQIKDRIIRMNSIEKHAKHWTDSDILVFDSYMWWLTYDITLLWGSFDDPDHGTYKKEAMKPRHYEMALRTWSDWLEFNINRTKTKMFFMSLSSCHSKGEDWGVAPGENCYGESEPIMNEDYWGTCAQRPLMETAETAIEELETKRGVRMEYINITHMTDLRKDAHPSIYRKQFNTPTKEQLLDPKSYSDCVHWCLPGVPDVWNQILYAYIINS